MKRVALVVALLSVLLMFVVGSDLDADQDAERNEIYRGDVDEGWYCILYSDGTASIIGPGKAGNYGTILKIPSDVKYQEDIYTVTELGNGAFKGAGSKLREISKVKVYIGVEIPSTIKVIGENCFEKNIWRIKENAGSPSEFSVKFENGCKLDRINNFCFSETAVKEIKIPDTVQVIGMSAFKNCIYLGSINLNNVKSIGLMAFSGCSQLKDTALEENNNLESVGSKAFERCKSISVDLSNCKEFYQDSFDSSAILKGVDFRERENDSGVFKLRIEGIHTKIFSFQKSSSFDTNGNLIIPRDVTYISSSNFSSLNIEKLSFESGSELIEIAEDAFKGKSISTVDFNNANKLQVIGAHAFSSCTSLKSVDLSKTSVRLIDTGAFDKCDNLDDVSFSDSIESISDLAFWNTSIRKIDLSYKQFLISIGERSFYVGTSVSAADSDKKISTEVISLSGSASLKSIGDQAFDGRQISGESYADLSGCIGLINIGKSAFNSMSIDISGCNSLYYYNPGASKVKFDENTPKVLNSDSEKGVSKAYLSGSNENILVMDESTFALSYSFLKIEIKEIKTSISEDGSVFIRNDRFVFSEGILYDSSETEIFKIVNSKDIIIKESVKTVFEFALNPSSISSIMIMSDIAPSFIDDEFSNVDVVVSGICKTTMEYLESKDIDYSIIFRCDSFAIKMDSDIGFDYAMPSISVDGGSFSIIFNYGGGYSDYDIFVTDGTTSYGRNDWVFDIGNYNLSIKAYDRSASDSIRVTFEADGGAFDSNISIRTVDVSRGLTLIDADVLEPTKASQHFAGWIIKGTENLYDLDSPLTEDIVLVAQWAYDGFKLYFETEYGQIVASEDGTNIESGSPITGIVIFNFDPFPGYYLESWVINGVESGSTELSIREISENTTVSVAVGEYSADSLKSLVLNNVDEHDMKDYSLSWKFGGVVDTSMATWSGHPSNPVIVGEYVYVRVSDRLYQISVDTGIVVNSVRSINQTSFYHHVGYGNGMIVDYANGNVYDTDLQCLYTFGSGISYAHYIDGKFICMLDGSPVAYDAEDEPDVVETKTPIWRSSASGWFNLYGTASTPIFSEGYMYMVCVDGKNIQLKSIDVNNGILRDSISLNTLYGQYLDDGWLSSYDNVLYLTSYSYGLFGSSTTTYKTSYVTSVSYSDGRFDTSSLKYTDLSSFGSPYNSLTSQFVVFKDRGYVYTCEYNKNSALLIFDIENMNLISEIRTDKYVPSHGSIVVDASRAAPDNNHAVSIYVISYTDSKLYVFHDNTSKGGKTTASESYFGGAFGSQAVRFGSNGEMIWYDDSGYLQCYAPSNNKYVFIQDGDYAKWYKASGKTASDAVSRMDSDIVEIADTTKTIASVNGKVNDGNWSLYAYVKKAGSLDSYEWKKLENLNNSEYNTYHYFVIVSGEVPIGTKYVYEDGGKYSIYGFGPDSDTCHLVGKQLVCTEDVVRITFTDSEGVMSESSYLIPGGKDVVIKYPEFSRKGYSLRWVDAIGNAAPYGIVTYNNDVEFHAKWIKLSYSIGVSKEESNGQLNCVANIIRTSGSEDLQDLMLFIIYEYEDGKFNNVYSDLSASSTTMTKSFGVSASGLESIYLYVVEGAFSGSFNNYGELIVDCSV